jgi:hypothetical protein
MIRTLISSRCTLTSTMLNFCSGNTSANALLSSTLASLTGWAEGTCSTTGVMRSS